MDKSYTGTYGRLRVLMPDFLSSAFIDDLSQKSPDDFVKALGSTSYKLEMDSFSGLYKIPDLMEVVVNAHMLRRIRNAISALPQSAKGFIRAYMGKWDVENIKTILSSKKLGYDIEHTEAFLMTERNIPVGTLLGAISREDYINMLSQRDIDGVVALLMKYGYGTILLKYADEIKKTKDLTGAIAALDMYWYSNMVESFRFYNGTETAILAYLKDLVDFKNTTTLIKALVFGYGNIGDYMVKGGTTPPQKIAELAAKKDVFAVKDELPFKIDEAFEAYRNDRFATYFEVALRGALVRRYLKRFELAPMSLDFIFAFILRCELERDELRTVWLGKYYSIKKERAERLRIMKYVAL